MAEENLLTTDNDDAEEREAPYELAPPSPSAMVESLRGVGYSLATAIADLIDNSIAAESNNVYLDFHWAGLDSWIRIIDDGSGMDEKQIHLAMKLGGKSPLDYRDARDLGRFGLGLKTASFSQCRRLTVASRKDDVIRVRQWNLDHIEKTDDWRLLTTIKKETATLIAPLSNFATGTIVVWEFLDKVVSQMSIGRQGEDAFLKAIDDVETHLSMVFHRFLEGAKPVLKIFINGNDEKARVRPWDPFMQDHPATIHRPTQPIQTESGKVIVKGFVLPHKDKLDSKDRERAAGPEGWTAQQGFYVYRNERMLVAGSWLGLGTVRAWTKEEAHKLARIRLDIPNSADSEWKTDIKKSVARPPAAIRPVLRAIAEDVRQMARRVFAHRGEYGSGQAIPDLTKTWKALDAGESVNYRINREHPIVAQVLSNVGDFKRSVEQMLLVLEKTVPVQRIWLDVVDRGEVYQSDIGEEMSEELHALLRIIYHDLRNRVGLGEGQAKEQLLKTEPFNRFPDLVRALL